MAATTLFVLLVVVIAVVPVLLGILALAKRAGGDSDTETRVEELRRRVEELESREE